MKVKNKQSAKHLPKSESRKQIVRKTPTYQRKQKINGAQHYIVIVKAEKKIVRKSNALVKVENKQCAKHQRKGESRKQ